MILHYIFFFGEIKKRVGATNKSVGDTISAFPKEFKKRVCDTNKNAKNTISALSKEIKKRVGDTDKNARNTTSAFLRKVEKRVINNVLANILINVLKNSFGGLDFFLIYAIANFITKLYTNFAISTIIDISRQALYQVCNSYFCQHSCQVSY